MTRASDTAKLLGAGGSILGSLDIGGGQIGRKNITINGGMQVAQRSASVTGLGATSGYFTLDRFDMTMGNTAGRFTASQSAVTDLEGFSNALKIDCTTADTSVAAGEFFIIQNHNEGLNLQQLKASSTSTRAFTLSFYAKSNASRAIASEVLLTNGTNKHISKLHTIGTSWARYTMTVPAASSTQIDNDNSNEMQLNFWIHGGTTYTGGTLNTASLAATTGANRAAGIGSIFASTNNTLEITGVQLEVGSVATPFEHKSFGEELALCHRYYYRHAAATLIGNGGYQTSGHVELVVDYPVSMRTGPSLDHTSGTNYYRAKRLDGDDDFNGWAIAVASSRNALLYQTSNLSGTAGDYARIQCNADGIVSFDAEL